MNLNNCSCFTGIILYSITHTKTKNNTYTHRVWGEMKIIYIISDQADSKA